MADTFKTKPNPALQTCLHIKGNYIIAFTTLTFSLTVTSLVKLSRNSSWLW